MPALRVSSFMSSPVISIVPTTRLSQMKNLMTEHHIRRLPVVEQDRPVGIVSLGDIHQAQPAAVATLSIYELTALLYKLTAKDVMRTEVWTIEAEATLIAAATEMLRHKVSGLPVVRDGHLVGMITESDIFRAFVGYGVQVPVIDADGRGT